MKRVVIFSIAVLAIATIGRTHGIARGTTALPPSLLQIEIEHFNFPGAFSTVAYAINDGGTIVGSYMDGSIERGFIRRGQVWTTITYPAANVFRTRLLGINNSGQIVGCYYDFDVPGACYKGFLLSDGTFTPIQAPGAFITTPTGINDAGDIVGWTGPPTRGFVRRGEVFTPIHYPSANQTYAYGIGNEPDPTVVGAVETGPGNPWLGYVRTQGNFTPIQYPGAASTVANGVNAAGQIAGNFVIGGNPVVSGRFLLTGSQFEILPISAGNVNGINNANQVVGASGSPFGGSAFVASFSGSPTLSHAVPQAGAPGQTSLNVLITGAFTHFVQGTTTAEFGAGISVNTVSVHNPNQATANLTIEPGAALGNRTITLTTAGEVVSLSDGFAVTSVGAPTLTEITPATYQQGPATIDVVVSGGLTHFAQGMTTANFGGGVTINSVTVQSATRATVNISIAPAAELGPRTVRLTTGSEVVSLAGGFVVTPGPALTLVAPSYFRRLQTNVPVQLSGQFTHFTQGTTSASFGDGVTVNSVTVHSPTSATAHVTISGSTRFGLRRVTVTTGGEIVHRDNQFVIWPTVNPGDFTSDNATDMILYRPSDGTWRIKATNVPSVATPTWGSADDVPLLGDFDGDTFLELAVYRPLTGAWYLRGVGALPWLGITWGTSGDQPVPADYDGDGVTDVAVYRPGTGDWLILTAASDFTSSMSMAWGLPGDVPVPGDYDGDMKTDFAVYRPSSGMWFILHSVGGYTSWTLHQWGVSGDVPVVADYDNDSIVDIAVYRPDEGIWFILQSTTGFSSGVAHYWGLAGDVPVPGDYDGDGKADPAVYRASTGTWFFMRSSGSPAWATHQWGEPGDLAVLRNR
jgi:hypothetical protein